jgi:hypothetical protein
MNRFIVVIPLTLFLTGCSTAGPRFQDTPFATEQVASDKTRIIFYREADVNFLSATLGIDGSIVGALAHNGFVVAETAPGDHKISAWVRYTPTGEFVTNMSFVAGETYYIRVSNRAERMLYPFAGPVGAALMVVDRKGEFQLESVPPAIALLQLRELKLSQ